MQNKEGWSGEQLGEADSGLWLLGGPGPGIQQQRAYLPLKRSSPRPQFYRGVRPERQGIMGMAGELDDRWLALRSPEGEGRVGGRKVRTPLCDGKVGQRAW